MINALSLEEVKWSLYNLLKSTDDATSTLNHDAANCLLVVIKASRIVKYSESLPTIHEPNTFLHKFRM